MIKKIIIVLIGLLVSAVAVLCFYIYEANYLGDEQVDPTELEELVSGISLGLNDLYIIAQEENRTDTKTLQNNNFVSVLPDFDGSILSYQEKESLRTAIVLSNDRYELWVQSGDNDWQTVVSNYQIKAGLDINPAESRVVFAEHANTDLPIRDVNGWAVYVYDIENKDLITIAPGYNPQFTQNNGQERVFFESSKGAAVVQVYDTYISYKLEVATTYTDSEPILVSPNGQYILIKNQVLPAYDVYEIAWRDPLVFNPVSQIASENMNTLSGTRAYAINGNQVEEYSLVTGGIINTHDLPGISVPVGVMVK